jgi:hypothetical protein
LITEREELIFAKVAERFEIGKVSVVIRWSKQIEAQHPSNNLASSINMVYIPHY